MMFSFTVSYHVTLLHKNINGLKLNDVSIWIDEMYAQTT